MALLEVLSDVADRLQDWVRRDQVWVDLHFPADPAGNSSYTAMRAAHGEDEERGAESEDEEGDGEGEEEEDPEAEDPEAERSGESEGGEEESRGEGMGGDERRG